MAALPSAQTPSGVSDEARAAVSSIAAAIAEEPARADVVASRRSREEMERRRQRTKTILATISRWSLTGKRVRVSCWAPEEANARRSPISVHLGTLSRVTGTSLWLRNDAGRSERVDAGEALSISEAKD